MSDENQSTLGLVLSPYFLATREAPAMTALVLGSGVVTLLPTPASGDSREAVRRAVNGAPRFLRLLDAWSWSGDLWRVRMVSPTVGDARCGDQLAAVYQRIESEPAYASLGRLTRSAAQAQRAEAAADSRDERTGHAYLDLLCADLLKGGSDPGVSVPVVAAMDRFSVAHQMVSVRGDAESLTQRIEARLARRSFSFGMPILTRASGSALLKLREDLSAELDRLRVAILRAFEPLERASDLLRQSAAEYAADFELWSRDVVGHDDEHGERIVSGFVVVSGVTLPADAAIMSGQAAASLAPPSALGLAADSALERGKKAATVPAVARPEPKRSSNGSDEEHSEKLLRVLVIREGRARPVGVSAENL